jgi:hypothetical protein
MSFNESNTVEQMILGALSADSPAVQPGGVA